MCCRPYRGFGVRGGWGTVRIGTHGSRRGLIADRYINQSAIALTADTSIVTDNFLYFDLARRYAQFRQISDGSSRGSLAIKLLAELLIVLPPSQLVDAFDAIAEPIVRKIESSEKRNQNLRTTRDLLLPKPISGELDVEDLDIDTGLAADELHEVTV